MATTLATGVLSFCLASQTASAQTTVTVSTAAQLQSAVSTANGAGGNRTILLADGTYTVTDTLYVNAPGITIAGQSGDRTRVIVQGDAMSASATVKNLIRIAARNVTVRDLTLQRAGWHLIQVVGESNADSPTVSNVVLRDAYQQLLKVSTNASPQSESSSSDGGLVENSLFEYSGGKGPQYYIGGIDAHAAKNWVVRGNTFRGIASPNTAVAEFAVHFWNHSSGNTVERNLIVDCDRGVGFGMADNPNSGGIIRNNMIYHSNNGAPFADTGIALLESPGTKVYNNTIIMENAFPWAIEYRYSSTSNVLIVNNLSNRPVQQRDSASGSVANNISNGASSWFANVPAGDLHLKASATNAIDRGIHVEGLFDDFDGIPRPVGSPIDIGADEYGNVIRPRAPTNVQAN